MGTNYKPCTWTLNSSDPKYTWEIKSQAFHKWPTTVTTATTIPGVTVAATQSSPTKESMMDDIMNRTEDQGFFKDVVDWLSKEAPRILQNTLEQLCYAGPVTYNRLCEFLYDIGFRTSELIERRMILGPSNKWVVEYFKDFPLGSGGK